MKENIVIIISIILIVAAGIWAGIKFYNYKSPIASDSDLNPISPSLTEQLKQYLQIEDLKIGKGTIAAPGNRLVVNYLGTLKDGTKFDSSYDRQRPFEFTLRAGEVIPGWDFGLEGMKVGGKRKLTIDPLLAYGDQQKGQIPANS